MPEKSFSSIALPILHGGMTKTFQIFYQLQWITHSIAKWALYSVIGGTEF